MSLIVQEEEVMLVKFIPGVSEVTAKRLPLCWGSVAYRIVISISQV